jgi:hypothetical protein
MSEKLSVRQLHDKATRGLPLSKSERKLLDAWYVQQDAEESVLLTASNSPTLPALQQQIDAALGQLQTVTHHIQALTSENETLKKEVAALYRQLAQAKTTQPV